MKVAIVGAGAAGLMCACMLPKTCDVTVFDKNPISGKKLLITGNGRCNVTNLVKPDQFLKSVPQNSEFLAHSISNFTPQHMVEFLDDLGIQTQVEDNNRVFPKQGGAVAVKQALENFATSRGVKFIFNSNVTSIDRSANGFDVSISDSEVKHLFDAVIVATGGLSFPMTGSSGDGYRFGSSFGHDVVSPRPALCGLQFQKPTGFQGSTVTCGIEIVDKAFKPMTTKETGNLLFTKSGVSGPPIFKTVSNFKKQTISDHFLQIDFAPKLTHQELEKQLPKQLVTHSNKKPFHVLREYAPVAVADWLVEISGLPRGKICSHLTKQERALLLQAITATRVTIKDFEDINTATVTRGGIDVTGINPLTMESMLVPRLFFIGEVLDVDALSGGFNLQIAFSTAVVCAKNYFFD